MKYYSENIVREMVKEAEDIAYMRSLGVKTEPLNIEDYPSIELPDEHGDLVELQEVEDMLCEESSSSDRDVRPAQLLGLLKGIPVILEASK